MKIMKALLFAVFCCSVIWLAFESADNSSAAVKPDGSSANPMKVNVQQFNRIAETDFSKAG